LTFKASYYVTYPGSGKAFGKPLLIVEPRAKATLHDACKASDAYVKLVIARSQQMQEKYVCVFFIYATLEFSFFQLLVCTHSLMPFAHWRRGPASEAQKKFIEMRWMNNPYLATKVDSIARMTKGDAHVETVRIRNGYIVSVF
jgi:hypothetical protein